MFLSTLLSGCALFHLSIAGYVLQDDYMKDFYGNFEFWTEKDPTNGFVQYVDQYTAEDMGLLNSTYGDAVSFGVDSTNITPNGRPSIRITSKKAYNTGLVVLDVEHMPVGCGTWPAFWMVGPEWPDNGEIDILEGVNDQEVNHMTLHTGPGCAISPSTQNGFTGSLETDNCHVDAPDQRKNAGCSIYHPSKKSYGAGLNANRGGVYATQWTDDAISVYFFPRGEIPEDVLGDSPDPSFWGKPAAKFSGGCDIGSIFRDNQIVIDTTFCGEWAGNVWEDSTCGQKAPTCNEYVRDNPEAFADAYWTINALKVYQEGAVEEPEYPANPLPSSTDVVVSSATTSATVTETPAPPSNGTISTVLTTTQSQETSRGPQQPPFAYPTPNVTSTSVYGGPTAAPPVAPLPTTSDDPATGTPTIIDDSSTTVTPSDAPTTDTASPQPRPTGGSPGRMPGFQWPVGGGNNRPSNTTTTSGSPTATTTDYATSTQDLTTSVDSIVFTPPLSSPTVAPGTTPSAASDVAPTPTTTGEMELPIPTEEAPVTTVILTPDLAARATLTSERRRGSEIQQRKRRGIHQRRR
ncbi:glycoside hydrolase family 16 protein [Sporormia fimetaria CBS 119925]|uniref:endo-1,3(4)-beta-glucanase n=1 Tax=Sporormia fimetaria CBS 119925 TaxID=1340428 RepID=A0A6A6UWJ4_9PLEO|nr:glycoside hydrolase family 16 protein [Sporormia fimetaria CBS 119925]